MPEVLAIIPARSGSKSIVDKNIRPVAGKPLLAWTIEQARAANRVTRTIVSTDSEAYAALAREYGAEVPFLRPAAIAADRSTDLEVFQHALDWLAAEEGYRPEICVHLRPTCPVRRPGLIDEAVEILDAQPVWDSVRTVTPVLHPPYKMWFRAGDGALSPVVTVPGIEDPWNRPRQDLPVTFIQTANVDVVRTRVIREKASMTGEKIYGLEDDGFHDVDTPEEFDRVERILERARRRPGAVAGPGAVGEGGAKVFCFDIDGVLATLVPDGDYAKAQPIPAGVDTVNGLRAAGHRIRLYTARGFVTGIDWSTVTRNQMEAWGVAYDELHFGKPAADYYVDDRMISPSEVHAFLDPA